jgi:peroxiredoxin 2/4
MLDHQDGVRAVAPLRLDEPAPYFEGRSTHGTIRLTDYAGKWLVFLAHPADFTPVCTSEFVAFAKHASDFQALHCALLGLSVDSVYSHLAWRASIKKEFGVDVDFPILEDTSLDIVGRYGMLQSIAGHICAVRALFVIDPKGLLRAMLWYPNTAGRSVAEVLRVVQALQTCDRLHTLTPEGWAPGEDTVEPRLHLVDAMEDTRASAYGCVDWYHYTASEQDGWRPD